MAFKLVLKSKKNRQNQPTLQTKIICKKINFEHERQEQNTRKTGTKLALSGSKPHLIISPQALFQKDHSCVTYWPLVAAKSDCEL